MKTAFDPRHQHRIVLMQGLFAYSFEKDHATDEISHVVDNFQTIDAQIVTCAPEWPIDKIARIDLAILRLSIWELLVEKKEPPKVIIDEAIELAKSFGNPNSPKFVNGVLGSILKTL